MEIYAEEWYWWVVRSPLQSLLSIAKLFYRTTRLYFFRAVHEDSDHFPRKQLGNHTGLKSCFDGHELINYE